MTPIGIPRRSGAAAVALLLALGAAGCTPAPDPAAWALEPIPFAPALDGHPREAPIDVAFGMSAVAADGSGGFWATSAGSWLHVSAEGETLSRFNAEHDAPLGSVEHLATLSPTQLVVSRRNDLTLPQVALFDTAAMQVRDLLPPDDGFDGQQAYLVGDVAAHDGEAYVLRLPLPGLADPAVDDDLALEVVRIDVSDGSQDVVHREPYDPAAGSDGAPGILASVDVDVTGRILLATPTTRVVLGPNGTELSRTPQESPRPIVAAGPDGLALWWGGTTPQGAGEEERMQIVGGSAEARQALEDSGRCGSATQTLTVVDAGAGRPLPLLCAANAAAWTGSSWVVATGGEGNGVLSRLHPPAG